MTDDGRRTTDHGRRTTDDGPRTTDRELRSADEIVQEALRRQAAGLSAMPPERVSLSPPERRAVLAADRFIYWLGHHWLAIANLLALLYVGVPFLAPVLMRAGLERPARAIYAFYTPLCHQLPFRSWYLFGAQPTYTQAELALRFPDEPLLPHTLIGDPVLGYKVALCQRDTAIYGAITLSGLGYALLRRRVKTPAVLGLCSFRCPPYRPRRRAAVRLLRHCVFLPAPRFSDTGEHASASRDHRLSLRPGDGLDGLPLRRGGVRRHPESVGTAFRAEEFGLAPVWITAGQGRADA
jgi:hypothetical protein